MGNRSRKKNSPKNQQVNQKKKQPVDSQPYNAKYYLKLKNDFLNYYNSRGKKSGEKLAKVDEKLQATLNKIIPIFENKFYSYLLYKMINDSSNDVFDKNFRPKFEYKLMKRKYAIIDFIISGKFDNLIKDSNINNENLFDKYNASKEALKEYLDFSDDNVKVSDFAVHASYSLKSALNLADKLSEIYKLFSPLNIYSEQLKEHIKYFEKQYAICKDNYDKSKIEWSNNNYKVFTQGFYLLCKEKIKELIVSIRPYWCNNPDAKSFYERFDKTSDDKTGLIEINVLHEYVEELNKSYDFFSSYIKYIANKEKDNLTFDVKDLLSVLTKEYNESQKITEAMTHLDFNSPTIIYDLQKVQDRVFQEIVQNGQKKEEHIDAAAIKEDEKNKEITEENKEITGKNRKVELFIGDRLIKLDEHFENPEYKKIVDEMPAEKSTNRDIKDVLNVNPEKEKPVNQEHEKDAASEGKHIDAAAIKEDENNKEITGKNRKAEFFIGDRLIKLDEFENPEYKKIVDEVLAEKSTNRDIKDVLNVNSEKEKAVNKEHEKDAASEGKHIDTAPRNEHENQTQRREYLLKAQKMRIDTLMKEKAQLKTENAQLKAENASLMTELQALKNKSLDKEKVPEKPSKNQTGLHSNQHYRRDSAFANPYVCSNPTPGESNFSTNRRYSI